MSGSEGDILAGQGASEEVTNVILERDYKFVWLGVASDPPMTRPLVLASSSLLGLLGRVYCETS